MPRTSQLDVGARVVYTRSEFGPCPPPDAHHVRPTRNGDSIHWLRDDHGEVLELRPDGLVLVRMEDGELRLLAMADPSLRRAGLGERLRHRRRVPRAG